MSIKLRKMDEKEITSIYESRMRHDFPVTELKPLENMIDMMERGVYECLLVSENDEPVGYALVLILNDFPYGLLDYLGVFTEKRNRGYGSRILSALTEYYKDRKLIVESEYPGDAPDEKMAERRIGFYQRNGAVNTGVESRIYGVHFVNFLLLNKVDQFNSMQGLKITGTKDSKLHFSENKKSIPPAETILNILFRLYQGMIPDEKKREKYLKFWIAN